MQCSIGSQCISTEHSNVEEVTKPIQMEEMAGMALEEETYTHRYRGSYMYDRKSFGNEERREA